MQLMPCLTYAVPVVALIQPPVLHLGHPQLVKLVHHDVLGFQHPSRPKARKQSVYLCAHKHKKKRKTCISQVFCAASKSTQRDRSLPVNVRKNTRFASLLGCGVVRGRRKCRLQSAL